MEIREFLQTEIWSKQTSRKILKAFGVCFATVAVIGGIVFRVEREWITPHERNAARVALADVESLQHVSGTSEDEYNSRKDKAETAVEKAKEAAWTWRDKNTAEVLFAYLSLTEIPHDDQRMRSTRREFYRKHPSFREPDSQVDKDSQQVIEFLHQVLHKVLD